jgi:hypothetical protein
MRATGSCLCGGVRFSVRGPLRDVEYCHCLMCQRVLTHFGAFTSCAPEALHIDSARKLKWYRSSREVRRGFCRDCGSQLFWEPAHGRHISISAGSLDQPTGLHGGEHKFVDQTADYDREIEHGGAEGRRPSRPS